MLKKINSAAIKEYLLKNGEKVAVGVCVFIALVLGILGLWRSMGTGRADGSSRSWAEEFKTHKERIDREVAMAPVKDLDPAQKEMLNPEKYVWKPVDLAHTPTAYLHVGEVQGADKRTNPGVLPIKSAPPKSGKYVKDKYIQLEYMRACILHYTEARQELVVPGAEPMKLPKGQQQGGVAGPMPILAKDAKPSRFVVGTAVFPMKDQVELFRKALRFASEKELFDDELGKNLPRPKGFILRRYEIGADGKPVNPAGEILIGPDPKNPNKLKVAASIANMLRHGVYDEDLPRFLEDYIFEGLVMPMPKLGNAHYSKPTFEEFKELAGWYDDDENGGLAMGGGTVTPMPMPKPGGGIIIPKGGKRPDPKNPMPEQSDPKNAGPQLELKPITKAALQPIDAQLAERLFSKDWDKRDKDGKELEWEKNLVNVYHALGRFRPAEDNNATGTPKQPNQLDSKYFDAWKKGGTGQYRGNEPVKKQPTEQKPEDEKLAERDAIVRFIDPEVEPGKTYQYSIQIRMWSPNFGKKDKVAFENVARAEELEPSMEVKTPLITIPKDYHLYAVDQPLLDDWAKEEKRNIPTKERDLIPFQIHQWVKDKADIVGGAMHVIGDMAIAERIAVRRGDHIGHNAGVVVPVWNQKKDAFEVPKLIPAKGKEKTWGVNIDLKESAIDPDNGKEYDLPFPVLVDFSGGKRFKSSGAVEEESAVEALVIMPDGKLKVLNSRIDSDTSRDAAKERHERVIESRRRADSYMSRPVDPKGISIPGKSGP